MRGRAGVLLAAVAVGCAQVGTPPGGEPDETAPRVREVRPAAFDTLTDLSEPVSITFDERISERLEGVATWTEAIVVSPATSVMKAERHGRRIEISLVDGWEPDRVYQVTLAPVYRDLFGNVRQRSVHLVFSTGASFWEGTVAGFAADRITGRPVEGARVEARRRIDETTYVAVTDTAGFFALRYLQAGAYDLVAWQDENRDRILDFFESQDSIGISVDMADTSVVGLSLLPQDSTPARLAQAAALDSTTVELVFDDYFAVAPVEGEARVFLLPDSVPGPVGDLVHPAQLDSIRAARADTVPRDTADPRDRPPQERDRPGQRGQSSEAAPPRPVRELILLLPAPLLADTTYAVTVEGVVNIRGVEGGGGTAEFTTPVPPPPDSATQDSVPADTTGAQR